MAPLLFPTRNMDIVNEIQDSSLAHISIDDFQIKFGPSKLQADPMFQNLKTIMFTAVNFGQN